MKGLLIKDFNLAWMNKPMLVIAVGIGAFMLIAGENMSVFVIGYVTLVCSMQVLSTITYDTYKHGNAFLMTLPVTRTLYVIEKYVFGLLCAAIGWGLALTAANISRILRHSQVDKLELLAGSISILVLGFLIVGFCIPIQLKFGSDNGRTVIMIVVFAVVAVGFVGIRALESMDINIDDVFERALTIKNTVFFGGLAACLIMIYLISFLFSLRIMKKKEF